MAPSDMVLKVQRGVVGYNNEIIISTAENHLSVNRNINLSDAHYGYANDTGEKGLVQPMVSLPTGAAPDTDGPVQPTTKPDIGELVQLTNKAASKHEDEKTALVVGGVAIILAAIWLLR